MFCHVANLRKCLITFVVFPSRLVLVFLLNALDLFLYDDDFLALEQIFARPRLEP